MPAIWSNDAPKEQKVAFMKTHVVPSMKPVFQAADATRYAEFGCKTCHGAGFKAPRDHLPKLTMKDGKLTAFAEKPEIAKFMAESVAPKMAEAMGLPPFDMQTGKGFGCAGCHAIEVK
jgi:cytochrome c553